MKTVIAILTLMLLMSSQAFARDTPIVNIENQAIKRFDKKIPSLEEVQAAIRIAANAQDWRVEPGDEGHIIATLLVRDTHTAIVDISYDQTQFSLHYKDSINLNYKKYPSDKPFFGPGGQLIVGNVETIHPNYNKWVRQLGDAIFNELQK